ncbi:MAG: hypothetical protein QOF89_5104 [Acidobacteriota bacterium]|nr:hypothetical protein [Acidobacteriota bacterium]
MKITRMMKVRFLWIGAVLLIVLPAFAQPPAAPPGPGSELGQLSFFAGEWSCKGHVEATPFGPAHATQATVHLSKELGGFWYVGHYAEKKTAENPQPMSFEFVEGYAPAAKTFTLDGFDAFGNRSHQTSPGWKDGKLVYVGESTGDGPATPARDTFTKKGDAALEHMGEMQIEGKWTAIDRESCTRVKK